MLEAEVIVTGSPRCRGASSSGHPCRVHDAAIDPQMIEALRSEPYVARSSDYAYRGENLADRVARVLGLLGVAGIAFISRRRARRTSTE